MNTGELTRLKELLNDLAGGLANPEYEYDLDGGDVRPWLCGLPELTTEARAALKIVERLQDDALRCDFTTREEWHSVGCGLLYPGADKHSLHIRVGDPFEGSVITILGDLDALDRLALAIIRAVREAQEKASKEAVEEVVEDAA